MSDQFKVPANQSAENSLAHFWPIYLFNIAPGTSAADITEALKEHRAIRESFTPHVRSGMELFALVVFTSREGANKAIGALDGAKADGLLLEARATTKEERQY
ncbi:hypothetical protein PTTG_11028 [Puccinia triticina 1-1 BBBD Race 1]|uniref:RRM domain-containing protein n=1 Tax=Puccinia triticina (isolate 1-1 / race 1 (BBBD)) TaxID=630390 RepID=A0A0C4FCS4_PUCT1|nr:hypothetical protein PTTG_11028 [Puccinia triticina 1-1 BBBD Race 1]